MKRILLLLILLASLLPAIAQKEGIRDYKFTISLSPALMNPGPVECIQAGVQIPLGNRFSLLAESALPVVKKLKRGLNIVRFSSECKYYFSAQQKEPAYISVYISYTHREWKEGRGFYFARPPDSIYNYDEAGIRSPIFIAALKFGKEFQLGRRLVYDWFIGMGVRQITTKYDAANATPGSLFPSHLWVHTSAWKYNYAQTRFHITMGFRVARRFGLI
jgi:hypothetical protein